MNLSVIKLHEMETKYHLFEIGKELNIPVWDLLRVEVCFRYIYKYDSGESNRSTLKVGNWLYTFWVWLKGFRLLLYRKRNLFISNPRDLNARSESYDKILNDLIEHSRKNSYLLIRATPPINKTNLKYYNYNGVLYFLRLFTSAPHFPENEFAPIKQALNELYNISVCENELNELFTYLYKQYKAYKLLFRILHPHKIISSVPFKPIFYAAQELNITSYEMQHAGIVFDYPSYSYPSMVTPESNIAFADYYVQFGEAWGEKNNIPAKRIVLGNNNFIPSSFVCHFDLPYILIISDSIHIEILIKYAKDLAQRCANMMIIYKLHPSEFAKKEWYIEQFSTIKNLRVLSIEYPLYDLIKYMKIMVLVYSSSFFEAISLNKKVAIIQYDNYYLLKEFAEDCKNAYFVHNVDDIIDVMDTDELNSKHLFYSPLNINVVTEVLK